VSHAACEACQRIHEGWFRAILRLPTGAAATTLKLWRIGGAARQTSRREGTLRSCRGFVTAQQGSIAF